MNDAVWFVLGGLAMAGMLVGDLVFGHLVRWMALG